MKSLCITTFAALALTTSASAASSKNLDRTADFNTDLGTMTGVTLGADTNPQVQGGVTDYSSPDANAGGAVDDSPVVLFTDAFSDTTVTAAVNSDLTASVPNSDSSSVESSASPSTTGNTDVRNDALGQTPEPATFALLGSALLGLGVLHSRKA
jgi:hypothetical protein